MGRIQSRPPINHAMRHGQDASRHTLFFHSIHVECFRISLYLFGPELVHNRALQEGAGCVVGGHNVGFPVPRQLLQGIPAATQAGLAVHHTVKALAI